ncbi:MAG: putative signal transducing protein [Anaerolineae bacterium]
MGKSAQRSNLVVVYRSQGPLGAEVAKSKLEANGIPALLRYQSIGRVFALTVDGLGLVEVLVNSEDEKGASTILEQDQDMQNSEPD